MRSSVECWAIALAVLPAPKQIRSEARGSGCASSGKCAMRFMYWRARRLLPDIWPVPRKIPSPPGSDATKVVSPALPFSARVGALWSAVPSSK